MPDRAIHVSEDTWRALQARSSSDETLDETIGKLLDRCPRADSDGASRALDEAVENVTFELEEDEIGP